MTSFSCSISHPNTSIWVSYSFVYVLFCWLFLREEKNYASLVLFFQVTWFDHHRLKMVNIKTCLRRQASCGKCCGMWTHRVKNATSNVVRLVCVWAWTINSSYLPCRTHISRYITGSIFTVFIFGAVLSVKWKAMVFLIHLFILWYKQSSELSSEFLCFVCQRGRVQNEFQKETKTAEGNFKVQSNLLLTLRLPNFRPQNAVFNR